MVQVVVFDVMVVDEKVLFVLGFFSEFWFVYVFIEVEYFCFFGYWYQFFIGMVIENVNQVLLEFFFRQMEDFIVVVVQGEKDVCICNCNLLKFVIDVLYFYWV